MGIGLTFQQVQKYEKGTNRVSAGRLQRIAEMLNMPVTFFYGGMSAPEKKRESRATGLAFLQTKGAMRLIRAFGRFIRARRNMRWWCWRSCCETRRGMVYSRRDRRPIDMMRRMLRVAALRRQSSRQTDSPAAPRDIPLEGHSDE